MTQYVGITSASFAGETVLTTLTTLVCPSPVFCRCRCDAGNPSSLLNPELGLETFGAGDVLFRIGGKYQISSAELRCGCEVGWLQ